MGTGLGAQAHVHLKHWRILSLRCIFISGTKQATKVLRLRTPVSLGLEFGRLTLKAGQGSKRILLGVRRIQVLEVYSTGQSGVRNVDLALWQNLGLLMLEVGHHRNRLVFRDHRVRELPKDYIQPVDMLCPDDFKVVRPSSVWG